MKRIILPVILAAAALFLFTGCGYDFLFGGELSVTITASADIDLWYNTPTLHLKSRDGGHRIDEKMSSSADGKSSWVTVSHLSDGDWDIWITLDDFADWESAGTTVAVKSRGLTAATGAVSLGPAGVELRWTVSGQDGSVPLISLDTSLSQIYLAVGWDYSDGFGWGGQSVFSLKGDFLDLAWVQAAYPNGTKIDSGLLGSRSYSSIKIDDTSVVIENGGTFGPGIYRTILEDLWGGQIIWSRTFEQSPQEAFGLTPVNPSSDNVWITGDPIKFQMPGWEKAEGYLIILFSITSGSPELIHWEPGPFTMTDQSYMVTLPTTSEYYLFLAVTDASLDNPAGLEAELTTEFSITEDPREVFRSVPNRLINYLAPEDEYTHFAYAVHRFYEP